MDDRRRRSSGALTLDPVSLLREWPADASVMDGARNAVVTCLGVSAGQRLILVVEAEYDSLAAPFVHAADALKAHIEAHVVDARKASHETFVKTLNDQLKQADASLFVGSVDGLPAAFRHALIDAGGERRRHGHMPGLTLSMLQQSMRTDYEEVHSLCEKLVARLAQGGTISVRTQRGTDLQIVCGARWHAEDGFLRGPGWTNLPAGEILACPESVDGVLVPDGGAWSTEGRAVRNADRLRVSFVDGRVVAAEGPSSTEPDKFLAQLDAHENGRRVGQVALGANVGIVAPVGNLLQDLKMPGFHLTLGHTSPEHTGADWNSEVEVPLLARRADVDVDDEPVLRAGRYVAPWVRSKGPTPNTGTTRRRL